MEVGFVHTSHRAALRSLLLAVAGTALAGLTLVMPYSASASTPHRHHAVHHAVLTAAQPSLVPAAQSSCAPACPAVPPGGEAYLGAWVQPNGPGNYVGDARVETELSELGQFQAELGRPLGLVHVYQDWDQPVSNSLLNAISSSGGIPIIDWSCLSGTGNDGTTTQIASGAFNAQITAFANQLKAYGKPVFLRWLWEPNLSAASFYNSCIQVGKSPSATADGAEYVAAWNTIFNIFRGTGSVGANNVSFVWNPGLAGNISTAFLQDFWPGYSEVDWIGIDGYSRPTPQQQNCVGAQPTFAQMFAASACTNLYTTLSGSGFAGSGPTNSPQLPMMIGETGAVNLSTSPNHQAAYLVNSTTGILSDFSSNDFPDIKAISYYDGTNQQLGANGTWTLQSQPFSPGGSPPSGFAAFAQLAASPFFSFLDPG
jgi:hypothetical protein